MELELSHKIDLLVVQPTTFCNIDCKYCYLPDRNNSKKISVETVLLTINKLYSEKLIGDELSIVWHSGEPLALNIQYFIEILEAVSKTVTELGIKLQHSVQTNGMLINDDWCELFKKYDFSIGISIDGPSFLHDINRVTRKGKGTHASTMGGIMFLQQHGIPYHAIAVVTKETLSYPEQFFSFFSQNGFFQLGLNFEEIEGVNRNSSLENEDNSVRIFLETLFQLYKDSDGDMKIREFSSAVRAILRRPDIPDIRNIITNSHQVAPLAIITVDTDGNFSSYSPELIGHKSEVYSDFILGNVHTSGFRDSLKTGVFSRMYRDINNGISKCKELCEYFPVCGGGAPSNKFFENGTFDSMETQYCRNSVKAPTDIVLKDIENRLERVRKVE
jgi:uncharacterized protein